MRRTAGLSNAGEKRECRGRQPFAEVSPSFFSLLAAAGGKNGELESPEKDSRVM